MYQEVVKRELREGGGDDRNNGNAEAEIGKIDLKTYSVKYLGITDGKIGILSRKLPIGKVQKAPLPLVNKQFLSKVKSVPVLQKHSTGTNLKLDTPRIDQEESLSKIASPNSEFMIV